MPISRLRIGWSFVQAAVSAGMFVASFHHTKKGCLLFVNLLCSLQAGLVTEPHPCQELRAQRWGSWGLESAVVEGQVPRYLCIGGSP